MPPHEFGLHKTEPLTLSQQNCEAEFETATGAHDCQSVSTNAELELGLGLARRVNVADAGIGVKGGFAELAHVQVAVKSVTADTLDRATISVVNGSVAAPASEYSASDQPATDERASTIPGVLPVCPIIKTIAETDTGAAKTTCSHGFGEHGQDTQPP